MNKLRFYEVTKHQLAEVCFNLAMQICEDNERNAISRIEQEFTILKNPTKKHLYFWRNWIKED